MSRPVLFRVPASTANLGAGFDALSLALNRYLRISIQPADHIHIEATGVDATLIPTTENNLICRVAAAVAKRRNRTLPPYHLKIENEIPLARGMGSSAAAIIAGITCYEALAGDWLIEQELFRCAFEFESHPDNLAAALFGNLISAAVAEDGTVLVSKLTIPGKISAVVVIPTFELSTEKARSVLPATYSRNDTVYNIQRAALTIAALTTGNWSLIREAMRDRIHQPFRAQLIPGLEEILKLEVKGLLGVALSGAGPTVFAFVDPKRTEEVRATLTRTFERNGVEATSHLLDIDTTGRLIDPS
ncbi:MAG TPA: homoserine kinase [Terriglobia bacterium]|nr:homoserine kinase [Terriglobia bacterium]